VKLLIALLLFTTSVFAQVNNDVWPYLQESMFDNREVAEVDVNELAITGPARASSGAQVPVTITVDTDRFVKIYLLIDNNPFQHAATFELSKATQTTEISTRIRMEVDSHVRAVAETANGELFMSKVAIRASGGCSGYMDVHDPELTKDLGKILYKKKDIEQVTRIKHPMFTGLQKDLDSGGYIPEWTVKTITWRDGDDIVLTATTYISISQDPYIKFNYAGDVSIHVVDTKGNEFTK
jgi:sulfur-oxidizing protein SoxY